MIKRSKKFARSLRMKTILAAVSVFAIALILLLLSFLAGIPIFLDDFERSVSVQNVQRVVAAISRELRQQNLLNLDYSFWNAVAEIVDVLVSGDNTTDLDQMFFDAFAIQNWTTGPVQQNLIALYGIAGNHLWSEYHPSYQSTIISFNAAPVPPLFLGQDEASVSFLSSVMPVWSGLVNPPGGFPTFLVSCREVRYSTGDQKQVGFMIWGAELSLFVDRLSNAAPACLSMWRTDNSSKLPPEVAAALAEITPGSVPVVRDLDEVNISSGSEPAGDSSSAAMVDWFKRALVEVLPRSEVEADTSRVCPKALPNLTSELSATYFAFSDGFAGHPVGPAIRLDTSRNLAQRGRRMVSSTAAATASLMLLLCLGFVVFLEVSVLRRLDRLRAFVIQISRPKFELVDDGGTDGDDQQDQGTARDVAESDYPTSAGSGDEGGGGDEIVRFGRLAGRRVERLKRALEKTSAALERQHRVFMRCHDALRVTNLWSGRDAGHMLHAVSFTALSAASRHAQDSPAVVPITADTFDDIIGNPIAFEFFKAFCASEGCAHDLFFLVDVALLDHIEHTNPGSAEARSLARSIHASYTSKKAATPVNLSEPMRRRLGKRSMYAKGIFTPAAAELRKFMTSEAIPKFRSSITNEALKMAVEIYGTDSRSTRTHQPKFLESLKAVAGKLRQIGEKVIGADELAKVVDAKIKESEDSETGSSMSTSSSSSSTESDIQSLQMSTEVYNATPSRGASMNPSPMPSPMSSRKGASSRNPSPTSSRKNPSTASSRNPSPKSRQTPSPIPELKAVLHKPPEKPPRKTTPSPSPVLVPMPATRSVPRKPKPTKKARDPQPPSVWHFNESDSEEEVGVALSPRRLGRHRVQCSMPANLVKPTATLATATPATATPATATAPPATPTPATATATAPPATPTPATAPPATATATATPTTAPATPVTAMATPATATAPPATATATATPATSSATSEL